MPCDAVHSDGFNRGGGRLLSALKGRAWPIVLGAALQHFHNEAFGRQGCEAVVPRRRADLVDGAENGADQILRSENVGAAWLSTG